MSVEAKASSGCRNWVVDMEGLLGDADKVKEESRWERHCIYRVPEWLKATDASAYSPLLVSLGPFHHGHPELLPMEEHKRRAMLHLVKRSNRPLQEFVDAVAEVAEELMDAYQDQDEEISWRQGSNKDRFVEMMVVDGCFLVEVMRMQQLEGKMDDYASNDPVFSKHGFLYIAPRIMHDVVVIENQLPLLLIERILVLQDPHKFYQKPEAIYRSVLDFLDRPGDEIDYINKQGLHPLDILHSSFTYSTASPAVPNRELCCQLTQPFIKTFSWFKSWQNRRQEVRTMSESSAGMKRDEAGRTDDKTSSAQKTNEDDLTDDNASSAQKMREAGIRFKRSTSDSFLDINFGCCGVLSMPCLQFHGGTTIMLLNMMAFERLHADAGNDVTAYVYFMDDIIDTVKDVEVLKDAEIIRTEIGSDEQLAKLFNDTLNSGIIMSPSSKLNKVRRKVYAHCKKRRNRWRANLIDTHFSNPWVFISFVAAVILLGATLVQTVCTARKC